MIGKAEIVNMALSEIGHFTNFSSGNNPDLEDAVNQCWQRTIDHCISLHDWKDFRRTRKLRRLSDAPERVSQDYVEGPGYVNLLRPEGEIDFVASPNLTAQPYDEWTLLGRTVKVETAAEIVAKKLWHRGDRATAGDLFDLSLVIEREPEALASAAPYLVRHRSAFLTQIQQRRAVMGAQFGAIDALGYRPPYDAAVDRVSRFLERLPAV